MSRLPEAPATQPGNNERAPSMSRAAAWLLHLSVAAVTLTGLVYGWMKYAMTTDDPFAVANHPLQPRILHLHILAAPLLVFGLGWIFNEHILAKWRNPGAPPKRRSGGLSMLLILPMILSGYLLQVFTDETATKATTVVHWSTSILFFLGYFIHQLGGRKKNGVTER